MAKKSTSMRYTSEHRAKLLDIWDAAQGTNPKRFEAVQNAGYAGGLSGWLQNVRSWRGPKKSKPVEASAVPAAKPEKAAGGLKRGRVGPEERAQIAEAHKAGKSAAEIAAKLGRTEKLIQSLLSQPAGKPEGTFSVAIAVEHADPLSGIPELFRDEFVAMIVEKIEQEHQHRVSHTGKHEDAVRLFFKIKEVLQDYDQLIAKLKSL